MIVSDLDGTLLNVNSFPLWIKFLLKKSFLSFHVILFINVFMLGLGRKVGVLTHSSFKAKLAKLDVPYLWNVEFSSRLLIEVNKVVFDELYCLDEFVLATAAPINYAEPFADMLFNHKCNVLASKWHGRSYIDNVGLNKKNNLEIFLNGSEITCFYTDHEEDLPTMLSSLEVVLVGSRLKQFDDILVNVNVTRVIN